jgi:hypothetical protein
VTWLERFSHSIDLSFFYSVFFLLLQSAQTDKSRTSVQTYFIPLPLDKLLSETLIPLESADVNADTDMVSMVAITISTDNTVITWDHSEDGYEADHLNPTQPTTEVWGDGDASNGCSPSLVNCTNEDDFLMAGDIALVMEDIAMPREKGLIAHDGGDRLDTNFPLAITRGAYPQEYPGSRLGGAVEVLSSKYWGTTYTAPVGQDVITTTDAFEYVAIYILAGEDDTTVTLPDGNQTFLSMGETIVVRVNLNDKIAASKPVQASLITGDIDAKYELRWFALLPESDWSNDYLAPVGDTAGVTVIFCFNPHDEAITIDYNITITNGTSYYVEKKVLVVDPLSVMNTANIPEDSSSRLISKDTFLALSLTDTLVANKGFVDMHGQVFDWGFPLMPTRYESPHAAL